MAKPENADVARCGLEDDTKRSRKRAAGKPDRRGADPPCRVRDLPDPPADIRGYAARTQRERDDDMADQGPRAYGHFNFLVDLGAGANGPHAGFQECSNIGMEVTVAEYRTGNVKESSVRKITGINKATDVTLKRGVISSADLCQWLDQIRNGDRRAHRTVTVQLQNEDHTQVVQTWKLLRAHIIKHVSGPFNAKGTDIAIEELTLAYDRIQTD